LKIYYNPRLKAKAQELRKNSTVSEILLWNKIKSRKMLRYQFMRQKPIDNYILDFYCSKLKLVIEIDGESHDNKQKEDIIRQRKLEKLGLNIIRFNDREVKTDIDGVLRTLESKIKEVEEKK